MNALMPVLCFVGQLDIVEVEDGLFGGGAKPAAGRGRLRAVGTLHFQPF